MAVKNKIHDLANYQFAKDEQLLFDTNVWLCLFPAPSETRTLPGGYSVALKAMLAAGVRLSLDVIVMSEYISTYCRLEFRGVFKKKYNNDFKAFRKSPDFTPVGQKAVFFTNEILKRCSRYDHAFANIDLSQALADFESGALDMNDRLLVESCLRNSWKFVTHDADCTEGGIDVLTTNPNLIAACP